MQKRNVDVTIWGKPVRIIYFAAKKQSKRSLRSADIIFIIVDKKNVQVVSRKYLNIITVVIVLKSENCYYV